MLVTLEEGKQYIRKQTKALTNIIKNISGAIEQGFNEIDHKKQNIDKKVYNIDGKKHSILSAGNVDCRYAIVHIHEAERSADDFVGQMTDGQIFGGLMHIAPNRGEDLGQREDDADRIDTIVEYLHIIINQYASGKKICFHGSTLGSEIAYCYTSRYPENIQCTVSSEEINKGKQIESMQKESNNKEIDAYNSMLKAHINRSILQ